MFLDKDTNGVQFLTADIFDPDSSLKQLDGQMNIVYIGLFLHLFDWEGQRKALERIVRLLKPEKGVLVLGQQVGSLVACDVKFEGEKNVIRHDLASFEKLWKEVGERTGTEWVIQAKLDEGLGIGNGKRVWDIQETRRLVFEVVRVS
jgi:ubiquinone/menaquinone biosynthesis C-methylase UbiE